MYISDLSSIGPNLGEYKFCLLIGWLLYVDECECLADLEGQWLCVHPDPLTRIHMMTTKTDNICFRIALWYA